MTWATLLVIGASCLIGWISRDVWGQSDVQDAFHRGYTTGRYERVGFRSIEEIQQERDALEADRLIEETRYPHHIEEDGA